MSAAVGSSWLDFRKLDPALFNAAALAPYKTELLLALRREFGHASEFVVKDPRICRFSPFWNDLAGALGAETRVVHVLRNPVNVARSLTSRDELSLDYGLNLWLRHVLDAEFDTRGSTRIFVNYEDIMHDWKHCVDNIETELQLTLVKRAPEVEAAVQSFIDHQLYHHAADEAAIAEECGSNTLVLTVYRALQKLVARDSDAEATANLDEARASFDRAQRAQGDGIGLEVNSEQCKLSYLQRRFPDAQLFLAPVDDPKQNRKIPHFRTFIRDKVKASAALEIGPSYSPILSKTDGYNVTVLDHTDQKGLRKKFADSPVDLRNIEPVDIVWKTGTLGEALAGQKFDSILASRAIERAPDFIQFLNDCSDALNETGTLFLVIPDKRYCFDLLQPISDAAKIINDHRLRRTRHTFESFYRQSMTVSQDGRADWSQHPIKAIRFMHGNPKQYYHHAVQCSSASDYIDSHENYFTPVSFLMLIDELQFLGELQLRVEVLTRSRGCEFLAVLRKDGANLPETLERFLARKLSLSLLRMNEDREMIAYALG